MPLKKIHLIAAARPNFMKIAPLYHALAAARDWAEPIVVHTGQHYDANMSAAFFVDVKSVVDRALIPAGITYWSL